MKERVLFLCTHNAARSQMAEGLLRSLGGDKYEVYSAGTEPTLVNPYAVQVMAEIGIDISKHYSKSINEFRKTNFHHVVSLCDKTKEICSFYYGYKTYEESFSDPSEFTGPDEEVLAQVRITRDKIREYIIRIFRKPE
ncbi:arsenate reductase ArsC [Dendrosporobacter sp. 1207_IL3150]|uniref:arsenate reductase ArsC n=1 Tax=Dendrosporobacter sp. 1207_IL3150 TaxID=3084054 RepID=UPI002FD96468